MTTIVIPADRGARDLQRGPQGRARRDAGEDPLLAREASGRLASSFVTCMTSSMTDRFEHLGHEARADPLDGVRPRLTAREDRRSRRLDGDGANDGFRALRPGHPRERPARPDAGHERRAAPSVSAQISSAVVRRWTSGFAGLLNCCGMKSASGPASTIDSARHRPVMPSSPAVRTSSAPYAPRSCDARRSWSRASRGRR